MIYQCGQIHTKDKTHKLGGGGGKERFFLSHKKKTYFIQFMHISNFSREKSDGMILRICKRIRTFGCAFSAALSFILKTLSGASVACCCQQ